MRWGQSLCDEKYHLLRNDNTALCGKKPFFDDWSTITEHVQPGNLCRACMRVYYSHSFKMSDVLDEENVGLLI